jgi:hypothetical protein
MIMAASARSRWMGENLDWDRYVGFGPLAANSAKSKRQG